jgi:hypothetical protein
VSNRLARDFQTAEHIAKLQQRIADLEVELFVARHVARRRLSDDAADAATARLLAAYRNRNHQLETQRNPK